MLQGLLWYALGSCVSFLGAFNVLRKKDLLEEDEEAVLVALVLSAGSWAALIIVMCMWLEEAVYDRFLPWWHNTVGEWWDSGRDKREEIISWILKTLLSEVKIEKEVKHD